MSETAYLTVNRDAYNAVAPQYRDRFDSDLLNDIPIVERVLESRGLGTEMSVLDVGCGSGANLRLFADRGNRVTGIDISPQMVEIASANNPSAVLVTGDYLSLARQMPKFGIVFAKAFVHLFPLSDLSRVTDSLAFSCLPNGVVYVATTDSPSDTEGFELKTDYRLEPRRYRSHVTERTLVRSLTRSRLTVVDLWRNVDPRNHKSWLNVVARSDLHHD